MMALPIMPTMMTSFRIKMPLTKLPTMKTTTTKPRMTRKIAYPRPARPMRPRMPTRMPLEMIHLMRYQQRRMIVHPSPSNSPKKCCNRAATTTTTVAQKTTTVAGPMGVPPPSPPPQHRTTMTAAIGWSSRMQLGNKRMRRIRQMPTASIRTKIKITIIVPISISISRISHSFPWNQESCTRSSRRMTASIAWTATTREPQRSHKQSDPSNMAVSTSLRSCQSRHRISIQAVPAATATAAASRPTCARHPGRATTA
mmetsp:Transcript_5459/g.16113  ORF Transcript_5459/g.16113 Transcript_5459/m.16113 type:complete len:256 (+) Transcript_5459:132-899(+)